MQKTVLYALIVGFVVFFIYQAPADASSRAGDFAGFVVTFLSRLGQFLGGLADGASSASTR